jgi:hypothetical protein
MRIGDLEYTRRVFLQPGVADTSVNTNVVFAVGIKVRPLLTRVLVAPIGALAVTGGQLIGLENGNSVPSALSLTGLRDDARVLPLWSWDNALATNGMGFVAPFESTWWKLLLPNIQIHAASLILGVQAIVVLHYRFAELTDDEIVEIAAQRAQE